MKVTFQTKEQSNDRQLESFLNLTKAERFHHFLQLSMRINSFPTKNKIIKSDTNFIINFKPKE